MGLLTGKVAIVTGAADGMGRAIAKRFREEGARVLATDVDAAGLRSGFADDDEVATVVTDITAEDAAATIVDTALERFGRLDIVVNAAGIFRLLPLDDLDFTECSRIWAVNLDAPLRLCVRALPALKASGAGRIVNIASVSASRARSGFGPYTISKHALAGLTISLAVEFGPYGITANSIDPGPILTGITRPLMADPEWRRDLESQGVLNRIGSVEEIAEAALYLVGPHSGFTTGHALAVDGGFLVKYPERLSGGPTADVSMKEGA